MTDAVIVAIITGAFTVLAVIITSKATRDNLIAEIKTRQAVTDTKIDALTLEVNMHNNFARRVPVVEKEIEIINKHIESIERSQK